LSFKRVQKTKRKETRKRIVLYKKRRFSYVIGKVSFPQKEGNIPVLENFINMIPLKGENR